MTTQAAPYFEALARGPAGGACHWLTTADNVRVRVGHWPLKEARGTILIFPGRTECVEKYGPIAADAHKIGLAAMAIDWRGQGIAERVHSDPRAGHVHAFGDYQRDVAAYLDHARALGMPEPFYLLGHSMGGCIGLRALYEGLPVDAAAFTGPMWGIALNPLLRPTAWAVSWASQKVGLSHLYAPSTSEESYLATVTYEENALTKDAALFDFMQGQVRAKPELQLGGPTLRWLREALIECRTLAQRPAPAVPTVTFLGTDESIVDVRSIEDRMACWPEGTLVRLERGEHEVLFETEQLRETIWTELAQHFSPRGAKERALSS